MSLWLESLVFIAWNRKLKTLAASGLKNHLTWKLKLS